MARVGEVTKAILKTLEKEPLHKENLVDIIVNFIPTGKAYRFGLNQRVINRRYRGSKNIYSIDNIDIGKTIQQGARAFVINKLFSLKTKGYIERHDNNYMITHNGRKALEFYKKGISRALFNISE